ncbi:metallophosphoesterase family protein [Comamonas terrigena]|uniref:metallophosphoesterase family protein n=1 Tax=Comamonas terrigena TaxID=32013 RepID=UPI0028A124C1|nr:metallophosphoesterase family protein [Comamonas terrigena]
MKAAFISDIHGNFEALKAVLEKIDSLGIKHIYCAGDVSGYYPQINECCDVLRARDIPCVMGNHDWYLGGGGFCSRSRSVNDCLEYQRRIIRPDNLRWLQSLPLQIHIGEVKVVHGGWADPIDEYLKPSEEYFQNINGTHFVSGHTHIQALHTYPGKTYCNPGSIGQPRDGNPDAAFATYETGEFTLHRTPYDMQKIFDLMAAAGFDDYYYGGLKTGSRNLKKL